MNNLKIMTWNLYQFAEPNMYWFEDNKQLKYTNEQWQAKLDWMAKTLQKIDADVIGLQEIFSVDACRKFMAKQGYPYFAVVQHPTIDINDPLRLTVAVVGIASRFPFKSEPAPVAMPQEFRDNTQVKSEFNFRRAILRAEISTPQLGNVTFYVCHFKSKGAFVNDDAIAKLPDWKTRFRAHLRQRSVKDADQLIQRSGDATGVYLAAMQELEANPDKMIVVMGDLNDVPESPTLRLITQQEPPQHIAHTGYNNIDNSADKAWYYHWRLYDTFGLLAHQNTVKRPATHSSSWHSLASTLDYILVSNSLNPKNPKRIAEVTEMQIYSEHFGQNILLTSDHAPVSVTFSKLMTQ